MKRLRLFLPLMVFALLSVLLYRGLSLEPEHMPSALIDKPLPEFELAALETEERRLSRGDLLGRVALINVWATWCPSCLVEHPYLMELAQRHQVVIYGMNYKDERDAALKWLQRLGDPYTLNIYDPQGTLGIDLGVFGAPETYVIDHKGVIRYKHIGVVNERIWQRHLQPLMAQLEAERDELGTQAENARQPRPQLVQNRIGGE